MKEAPFAARPKRPAPSTHAPRASSLTVAAMARLSPPKPSRNRCDNKRPDMRRIAALAVALVVVAAPPAADAFYRPLSWSERKTAAVRFVESRSGVESFAFVDQSGHLRGYRPWRVAPSASVLK